MTNIDRDQTASILRLVDREVWIVTAADGKRRGGLVATWVSQASIDDQTPIVLAGIAPNHFTAELIDASGAFALHLVTEAQIELVWRFAIGSGRDRDKLAGIAVTTAQTGSPVLSDCLAWLDCRVFARLPAGDRIFFWADVVGSGMLAAGQPLCEKRLIELASDEQRQQLAAGRMSDVRLQRPMRDAWRDNLPDGLRPK